MKKIGYIYKYNEEEKMGILVYGYWNVHTHRGDKPILFFNSDCKTKVSTDNLVYFEYENGTASNIECASLNNFDERLILEYSNQRNIIYENIKEISYGKHRPTHFECRSKYLLDDSDLPDKIEDLFNLFGKYDHAYGYILGKRKKDEISIRIFDIDRWVDSSDLSENFYGESREQLLFLFQTFIVQTIRDNKCDVCCPNRIAFCIASAWKTILSRLKKDVLDYVVQNMSALQPALPIDYCLENINNLTDNYGMPNKEVCKAFVNNMVDNIDSALKYEAASKKISTYFNCSVKHLPKEGIPMCSIGESYIQTHIIPKLEALFKEKIEPSIRQKFDELSEIPLSKIERSNGILRKKRLFPWDPL